MSCNVWFKQEADVNPDEDFLLSRHEYLLNRLTSSAVFNSSNISQLASEILLTLHTMDYIHDNNVSSTLPFWAVYWKISKGIEHVISLDIRIFHSPRLVFLYVKLNHIN
jgi:hypothetical protein